MINALFAVGPNGEFGTNNGRLPWGSFPEELENFYSLMENDFARDIVLIGKNTYETAPPRLRNLLCDRLVLVYGRSEPKWHENVLPGNHKLITKIGKGLVSYAADTDIVAIGGKTVLHQLMKKNLLNSALRSVVYRKDGSHSSIATVYLDPVVVDSAFKDAAIIQHRTGENLMYRFVLEGVYL